MGFADGLNQMSMNDSEMALFSAAVLLSPDRPVINDAKGIGQHQERLTEALRLQVRKWPVTLRNAHISTDCSCLLFIPRYCASS